MYPLKAWQPPDGSVQVVLPATRPESKTILGAVSLQYKTVLTMADSTNRSSVTEWLKEFRRQLPDIGKVKLVLDNHPSHHSYQVRWTAEELDVELMFLPTHSSVLNPVESFWSKLKHELRKRIAEGQG